MGPECTGKTTAIEELCKSLDAEAVATTVVPEAGRIYAAEVGVAHEWTPSDELEVGRLHLRLMTEMTSADDAREAQVLLSDGAVVTPRVWSLRAFGMELPELPRIDDIASFDLVALMTPDLPWVPDPLRTSADNREVEFGLYQQLLQDHSDRVITVSGTGSSRVFSILAAIRQGLSI